MTPKLGINLASKPKLFSIQNYLSFSKLKKKKKTENSNTFSCMRWSLFLWSHLITVLLFNSSQSMIFVTKIKRTKCIHHHRKVEHSGQVIARRRLSKSTRALIFRQKLCTYLSVGWRVLTLKWGMAGICKWRKLHFKDPPAPQLVIIITQAKKIDYPT